MKRHQHLYLVALAAMSGFAGFSKLQIEKFTRKLARAAPYKRKKPTRQEDFDRLEKAEQKRRQRAAHPMRACYSRQREVVPMFGKHHVLPNTLRQRIEWEFERMGGLEGTDAELAVRARTAVVFARKAMNLENCG